MRGGLAATLGTLLMGQVQNQDLANWGGVHKCRVLCHAQVPEGWSMAQAAAVPEQWLTAYQLLHLVSDVRAGQTVVVHAAGSGVGTAAIQLARDSGLRVFATAGTEEKLQMAR